MGIDMRRDERAAVAAGATCRAVHVKVDVVLTNLSISGCCVVTQSPWLRKGQFISLKLDGLEALTGTVTWADGEQAGVRFDRDLYQPVFQFLCEKYEDGSIIRAKAA